MEDIASILTLCLTMAASSEFVRSHVDPEGFALAKAKESHKKKVQLASSGAELAIRKVLSTPLDKLDIDHAINTIEEAERQNVQAILIDKAAEHTEKAIELHMTNN